MSSECEEGEAAPEAVATEPTTEETAPEQHQHQHQQHQQHQPLLPEEDAANGADAAAKLLPPLEPDPEQWEALVDPASGDTFYSNEFGAKVDAIPDGDVVVGDLPFPGEMAGLEVKSDSPPPPPVPPGLRRNKEK